MSEPQEEMLRCLARPGDAALAGEPLPLPDRPIRCDLRNIPFYWGVPAWARRMGCEQLGRMFHKPTITNRDGVVVRGPRHGAYHVRLAGLCITPMRYHSSATHDEDRLLLNDRRVFRVTHRGTAGPNEGRVVSRKFIMANGEQIVTSNVMWMRISDGILLPTLRCGQGRQWRWPTPGGEGLGPPPSAGQRVVTFARQTEIKYTLLACQSMLRDLDPANGPTAQMDPASALDLPIAMPTELQFSDYSPPVHLPSGPDRTDAGVFAGAFPNMLQEQADAMRESGLNNEAQRIEARNQIVTAVVGGEDPIQAATRIVGPRAANVLRLALQDPAAFMRTMISDAEATGQNEVASNYRAMSAVLGVDESLYRSRLARVGWHVLGMALARGSPPPPPPDRPPPPIWSALAASTLANVAARRWTLRRRETRDGVPHAHPMLLLAMAHRYRFQLMQRFNPTNAPIADGPSGPQPAGGEHHAEQILEAMEAPALQFWRETSTATSVQEMENFKISLDRLSDLAVPNGVAQIPHHVSNLRLAVCSWMPEQPPFELPPGYAPAAELTQRGEEAAAAASVSARAASGIGNLDQRVRALLASMSSVSARQNEMAVDDDGFPIYHIGEDGVPALGRGPDVAPDATLDKPTEAELAKLQGEADEEKKGASGGAGAAKVCVVCMDNPVRVVFTGCGHATCCAVCVNKLERKCPTCRKVSKPIRMFM